MLKETRQILKHLMTCMYSAHNDWTGNNDVFILNINIDKGNLRVTVDTSGGFEIRQMYREQTHVLDHNGSRTTTESEVKGLKAHQAKQDLELVQSLANKVKETILARYASIASGIVTY